VLTTSDKENSNFGHGQEITAFTHDHTNHLIISAGWDSQILVQKEFQNDIKQV
jgi:hypothetical protein